MFESWLLNNRNFICYFFKCDKTLIFVHSLLYFNTIYNTIYRNWLMKYIKMKIKLSRSANGKMDFNESKNGINFVPIQIYHSLS